MTVGPLELEPPRTVVAHRSHNLWRITLDNLKLIPGTMGFMASEDGVIYDPSGIVRATYNNADGYVTCSVKILDGSWVTFGVQRLVASAHLECPGDPADFVVNHVDLDVENNHVNNLEWVTVEQNNIHAALFGLECDRIQLEAISEVDGKMPLKVFAKSIEDMAELTFTDKLEIWRSIKDSAAIGAWRFKYIRAGEKPKELHSDQQFTKGVNREADFYVKKPIWIKDLDTEDIAKYESVTAAAKTHKVECNHINFAICKPGKPRLFKKNFMVSDTGEFPELTAEDIDKRRASGGRLVIGYCIENKTLVTAQSAGSFVREYNLSKKAITTTLKDNRLVVKQGWLFVYDTPENRERLFDEIKRLTGSVPD